MEVKIYRQIPHEIYKVASSFERYSIYHSQEWHEFLSKTFGWRVSAVAGEKDGRVAIFLPFISKRRLGTRKYHICLPLSHRVGAAWKKEYEGMLGEFWIRLGELFSNFEAHDRIHEWPFSQRIENNIVLLDMRECRNEQELFMRFSKDSIRRKINKAEKSGITVETATSCSDIRAFMWLMAETRKRQGSPTYPSSFFPNLFYQFRGTSTVHLYSAKYRGRPFAGIVFFHFKNTGIYAYGASTGDRNLLRIGINQLPMWEAIRDAYWKGIQVIDFGLCPVGHNNLLNYKLKWGGASKPAPHSYIGKKTRGLSRRDRVFAAGSMILKKLPMPLFEALSSTMIKFGV